MAVDDAGSQTKQCRLFAQPDQQAPAHCSPQQNVGCGAGSKFKRQVAGSCQLLVRGLERQIITAVGVVTVNVDHGFLVAAIGDRDT